MKVDLHTISKTVPEPLHQQLNQLIRKAIHAGVFKPGERIAPERQFIEEGGLSYPTVARAFKDLAEAGLVVRKSGAGTFVSETLPKPKCHGLKRIGVSYYSRHTPYFSAILRGIEDECRKLNIAVVTIATGLDEEEEVTTIRHLDDHKLDAFIGIPMGAAGLQSELKRLLDSEMPLATIAFHVPSLGCDAIVFDNEHGARLAAEHLLEMGHRRIACIGNELKYPHTLNLEIIEGVRQAYQDWNMEWDSSLALQLPMAFHEDAPAQKRAVLDLVRPEGGEPVSACICSADGLARYVAITLGEAGLRVPGDVSIVGFGDLPLATRLDPPLTTIVWPLERAGRRAVRSLIDQANGQVPHSTKTVLDTSLVIRRSTSQYLPEGYHHG